MDGLNVLVESDDSISSDAVDDGLVGDDAVLGDSILDEEAALVVSQLINIPWLSCLTFLIAKKFCPFSHYKTVSVHPKM